MAALFIRFANRSIAASTSRPWHRLQQLRMLTGSAVLAAPAAGATAVGKTVMDEMAYGIYGGMLTTALAPLTVYSMDPSPSPLTSPTSPSDHNSQACGRRRQRAR